LFGDAAVMETDGNEKEKTTMATTATTTEHEMDKKKKIDAQVWEKMKHRIYQIIKTTPNIHKMTIGGLKKQLRAEFSLDVKPYKPFIIQRVREVIHQLKLDMEPAETK